MTTPRPPGEGGEGIDRLFKREKRRNDLLYLFVEKDLTSCFFGATFGEVCWDVLR
jgi:hypothetical protein